MVKRRCVQSQRERDTAHKPRTDLRQLLHNTLDSDPEAFGARVGLVGPQVWTDQTLPERPVWSTCAVDGLPLDPKLDLFSPIGLALRIFTPELDVATPMRRCCG